MPDQLNAADIAIILDTLIASEHIADGGQLFRYTISARHAVIDKIIRLSSQISVPIVAQTTEKDS